MQRLFDSRMLPRFLLITLCVIQLIHLSNAQTVIAQAPIESCVSRTVPVDCPGKYVAVVRSAFYGVGQTANLCKYTQGDCLSDTMSIVSCTNDAIKCSVYATRKKLPECQDQFSTYIRIEYDCVPIEMDNAATIYNVCQNDTKFTSDTGIIRSPGYPSQFQTTKSECVLSLTAPQDKQIRLWLSDLFIGSTLSTCARDHVIVVDDVQTFRFCAQKRFAFPYLCSSSILIQYKANTSLSLYRGMRMFYEFVDRVPNDGCPAFNGTLTPEPDTTTIITTTNPFVTTTLPAYVQLGISSPVRNFQICRGDSQTIECPDNYAIVVIRNLYGVSPNGTCQTHDESRHCFTTTDPTTYCHQRCTYFYSGNIVATNCENKIADYQYVEYQCIPINSPIVSPNVACPTDGSKVPINIDRKGRFRSYNYPILQSMNCTYRLKAKPNEIINVYSIDISMNSYIPECTSNKLVLIEDGETEGFEVCEKRGYNLIYASCSNEVDLRYIVGDAGKFLSSGAELYIEAETRPFDWTCGKPTTTTTTQGTTRPPTATTTTTSPKPLTTSTFDMGASAEMEYDICFGKSLNERCATGYTFMVIGAYYGVKKYSTNTCGFTQGDCVQEALSTITACQNDQPGCFISYSAQRRLALCADKYADYLHITGQCIPSSSVSGGPQLTQTGICDSTDEFFAFNGIVTSPGFPNYQQTRNECKRTLIGPTEHLLQIWINEMSIATGSARRLSDEPDHPDLVIHKTRDTDSIAELEEMNPALRDVCTQDYLLINSPQIAYVYCGKNKLTIGPFCAGRVTIQYKTTATPLFTYKGFKLYFEWIPQPVDVDCNGLIDPILTTTPAVEILDDWAQNLELSPILSTHICLGQQTVLRCQREKDYVLALVDANYAVTGTGSCDIPSISHCRQEVSLSLTCTKSCPFIYNIPRPLSSCQNQNADYLNLLYECIPTTLPNNEVPLDICSPSVSGTIVRESGIITSPQYPGLNGVRRCGKTLEALPGKLWLVFLTDLSLESENDFGTCDQSSMTIYDGNEKSFYCGSRPPALVRISCSNIIQIEFVSTHTAIGYRGFRLFYQTIDAPPGWACVPNFPNATTLTTRTTTRGPTTTTLIPPSLQIAAFGGTTTPGARQYCTFPFIYNGRPETGCSRTDPPVPSGIPNVVQPWCSLTGDYDTDRQWGFCDLGVTSTTMYDICRSQSQMLRCPENYVIDILAAMYAAKPDGSIGADSCSYSQNDCFQNDVTTIQNVCAGKPSCTAFHFVRTIANCQNRPSAYLHVHYACVPNTLPDITTYNICNSTFVPDANTVRGYLTSPGFPQASNDYDCTYNLQTTKPNQDIHLYLLDMDLNIANVIGQTCTKDRLILRYDNGERELCGRGYTDLIATTCHSSISVQLIRASDARGRGVKFYFEFKDRPPQLACPPLVTTTTQVTLSPTQRTTTATGSRPSYFPNPSGRFLQKLCYPDVTGLFGTNNVQCPQDYVIVIHRAFYGKGSRCDYTSGDCILEADNVYRTCSGKRACSVLFLNQVTIAECNNALANYLFIEYQCLPTPDIVDASLELCKAESNQLAIPSGILRSSSYPTYAPSECNNVTLSPPDGLNLAVHVFLLDMNIGTSTTAEDPCADEYLLLSYQCNNVWYSERLCGARSTELLFDTCSPTDKFSASYKLISQDPTAKRGFALLYHFVLPQPPITSSSSRPTTTPTTRPGTTTTTSTLPPGPGAVSISIEPYSGCTLTMRNLACPQDYVIILNKVYLATKSTPGCTFSADDCYEDRTSTYNSICAGKRTCSIFPPQTPIKSCNNSQSKYLYTEHQCIPTRPKVNVDVCSSAFERVEGGAIVSSLNYNSLYQNCQVQLQSRPLLGSQQHRAFKIFILSLNLPMTRNAREQGAQCSDSSPYIEINDPEQGVTRLCGSSHSRYLSETCATSIDIRFQNFLVNTGTSKFKGFELYFESIENQQCRIEPVTTLPTPLAPLAFRTEAACSLSNGRERVNMYCPADHGIIILESYQLVTTQPSLCAPDRYTCRFPSDQPRSQCSGQQRCSYTYQYPLFPSPVGCSNGRADTVEFTYQCVPMRPVGAYPTTTFCQNQVVTSQAGFIETPSYPNPYQPSSQLCSIRLPLPADNAVKQYSVYLYIIDLALRDTTAVNPLAPVDCLDSITYTDGTMSKQLCGLIDQPVLEFRTNRQELNLTLNISQAISTGTGSWRGARLFYVIGNQSLPVIFTTLPPAPVTTPTSTTSTTTRDPTLDGTTTESSGPAVSGGAIAGIIIGILVAAVILVVLFLNRHRFLPVTTAGPNEPVRYRHDTGTVDGVATTVTKEQRSSVSSASLKKPTSLINPNYRKPEPAKEESEATDA